MWVTAPFLLLLLDFWPLQRASGSPLQPSAECPQVSALPLKRLILEKLPLLTLSALSSAVTLAAQHQGGALVSADLLGFGDRLSNAAVSYARYLGKTFWPAPLAAFYPQVLGGPAAWQVGGAAAILLLVTIVCLRRLRPSPWLAVGWFWFLGALVPVIGFVQVGEQAMADRYTYVPLIGLFVAVVWEGGSLAERLPSATRRRAVPATVLVVTALLCGQTWHQLGFWKDQETLFRHTIAVTENNGRAHLILAQALAERGDYAEALLHAGESVRLDPSNPRAHKNLGFTLYRLGRVDEAIAAFQRAIALKPDYAEAHGNLGIAYGKKGWMEAAMREMSLEAELRASAPDR
jgi:tetratricopeptide (TPR) repeat protein